MVRSLQSKLNEWKANKDTDIALFIGAGPKAFCAGGDIKSLLDHKNNDNPSGYIL